MSDLERDRPFTAVASFGVCELGVEGPSSRKPSNPRIGGALPSTDVVRSSVAESERIPATECLGPGESTVGTSKLSPRGSRDDVVEEREEIRELAWSTSM